MAEDWASDVRKYVPDADDSVIKGIVRYCGIALQKRDSSLVSYGDPVELRRVRENFLKKRCGLTHSDDHLDAAIATVGERMKGENFKNRVTVYYLLLDHFDHLHIFRKDKVSGAANGAADGAAAVEPVGMAAPLGVMAAAGAGVAATMRSGGTGGGGRGSGGSGGSRFESGGFAGPEPLRHVIGGDSKGALGLVLWALAGAALLWALYALFTTEPKAPAAVTPPPSAESTSAVATPVAVPEGAGVTSEMRDGRPMLKVYFDTGKSEVTTDFAAAAAPVKAYVGDNPSSMIGVSGYNDPSGNAAANAELSKDRAQAVRAALVLAGIPETAIELVKPEATTDAQVTKEEARRVEVFVK